MSIIVPSNHTRIGAWVNSKMSGRNPLVYCTIPLIALQEYHTKQHIQRIDCQPEKTTLHGGQSRSWSAEQGGGGSLVTIHYENL